LVRTFLKESAGENNKAVEDVSPDAMQAILRYDWPGNVRELRTAIEHGVVMSRSGKVTLRDLPESVRTEGGAIPAGPRFQPPKSEQFDLHANEHTLILQALDETGGNVTHAARKLGISRRTLHRKLKALKTTNSDTTTDAD
jgi:DNA-binding NtrC family response regulator